MNVKLLKRIKNDYNMLTDILFSLQLLRVNRYISFMNCVTIFCVLSHWVIQAFMNVQDIVGHMIAMTVTFVHK